MAGLQNPIERPQAANWEAALVRLTDRAVACTNSDCEARAFPFDEASTSTCPWCGTKWRPDAEFALIDLFRPVSGRRGQYQRDNWQIVAHHGRQLYEWHAHRDRPPGPCSNSQSVARFEYDVKKKSLYLINTTTGLFTVLDKDGTVHKTQSQESCHLKNEARIILGESQSVRLGLVRFPSH